MKGSVSFVATTSCWSPTRGPYVNVYAKGRHGWKKHLPVSVVRVLDESTCRRGRFHPSEVGRKGIDIDHGMQALAMTCAERGLAFFDLTRILEKRVIPLGWIGKSIEWRYEWIRDDLRRRRGWE
jgi:hypothetical protein